MAARPEVVGGEAIADQVTYRIMSRVLDHCERTGQPLEELLYETIYCERQRLELEDDTARSRADRQFIKGLRHELAHADTRQQLELLRTVLARYGQEICGHFDRRVYGFATSVLPSALGVLLHGGAPGANLFGVDDRILVEGDLAGLSRAAHEGTVVLVPTHVSNLDSLVLGHALYRLGLPPFAYGAGLNLFSNPLTGFFMRHLGAFTVDRKKGDPLYREAVKEYATVLLEHGQHLLFFPGGTRSRSGALEEQLKLGFLGTVIKALATRRARDPRSRPLYIVPCTLSYPLVLEGASLIESYLSTQGGSHFVDVRDEFERPTSWLEFLGGLAELDVQMHVRFESPLDPLGNSVDALGVSRDPAGRPLDPMRYLLVDGELSRDDARDAEYTKTLAASVLASYRRGSVALPSSALAFALFVCLRRRFPKLDLFRFLRVLGPRATVPIAEVELELEGLLIALRAAAQRGDLALAPALQSGDRATVLAEGIATLSTYHRVPVLKRRGRLLEVAQPALLLYYRNRLEGFGLPGSEGQATPRTRPSTWSTP